MLNKNERSRPKYLHGKVAAVLPGVFKCRQTGSAHIIDEFCAGVGLRRSSKTLEWKFRPQTEPVSLSREQPFDCGGKALLSPDRAACCSLQIISACPRREITSLCDSPATLLPSHSLTDRLTLPRGDLTLARSSRVI
jgi:hypothetical protein